MILNILSNKLLGTSELKTKRERKKIIEIAGESTDMYAETLQSDNNEVDVDDSSEPNQSNPNASTSSAANVPNEDDQENTDNALQPQETQQIQTISASDSGSSGSSTPSTWRGQSAQTPSRQQPAAAPQTPTQQSSQSQQSAQNTPQQQPIMLNYEEPGDDSIVPSTPTLYVPRRADGFSEAVSSPQPHVSGN